MLTQWCWVTMMVKSIRRTFRRGFGTVVIATKFGPVWPRRVTKSRAVGSAGRRHTLFHNIPMCQGCQIYCRRERIMIGVLKVPSSFISCSLVVVEETLKKERNYKTWLWSWWLWWSSRQNRECSHSVDLGIRNEHVSPGRPWGSKRLNEESNRLLVSVLISKSHVPTELALKRTNVKAGQKSLLLLSICKGEDATKRVRLKQLVQYRELFEREYDGQKCATVLHPLWAKIAKDKKVKLYTARCHEVLTMILTKEKISTMVTNIFDIEDSPNLMIEDVLLKPWLFDVQPISVNVTATADTAFRVEDFICLSIWISRHHATAVSKVTPKPATKMVLGTAFIKRKIDRIETKIWQTIQRCAHAVAFLKNFEEEDAIQFP